MDADTALVVATSVGGTVMALAWIAGGAAFDSVKERKFADAVCCDEDTNGLASHFSACGGCFGAALGMVVGGTIFYLGVETAALTSGALLAFIMAGAVALCLCCCCGLFGWMDFGSDAEDSMGFEFLFGMPLFGLCGGMFAAAVALPVYFGLVDSVPDDEPSGATFSDTAVALAVLAPILSVMVIGCAAACSCFRPAPLSSCASIRSALSPGCVASCGRSVVRATREVVHAPSRIASRRHLDTQTDPRVHGRSGSEMSPAYRGEMLPV